MWVSICTLALSPRPLQHCVTLDELLASEPQLPYLQNEGNKSRRYFENLKCN